MPILFCRHLDKRTEWKVVTGDSFTIGFSENASVPFPDPALAPREARVSRSAERYLLRDLAEKDRVYLNGVATRESLLKDGDRLLIGRIAVLFLDDVHAGGGEVDLFPREEGIEDSAAEWDLLAGEAKKAPPSPSERPEEGPTWGTLCAVILILSLLFGIAFGLLYRVPRPPRPAAKRDSPLAPLDRASPMPDEMLRRLEEMLAATRKEPAPVLPGVKEAAVAPAPEASPETSRYSLENPGDPAASRVCLFRIFLDVAGRPPTRAEEKEAIPLSHEERFRKAHEIADREGTPPTGGAAGLEAWLGRPPSPEESLEIERLSTPARPAELWLTAHEDYRNPARRRPRSLAQRARSFLVDLLDRPPASRAEVELVEAALAEAGLEAETARVLAHSPESRLPASGAGLAWEEEFFRFLLRPPSAEEGEEILRALGEAPEEARRRRLVIALAALPGYGSY